jgi:hypothetical protein
LHASRKTVSEILGEEAEQEAAKMSLSNDKMGRRTEGMSSGTYLINSCILLSRLTVPPALAAENNW